MKQQRKQNTPTFAVLAIAAMLTVLVTGGRTAWADSKADIDRELLEKLGGEPVDDLDRELFAPEKKSSGSEPSKEPTRKAVGTERSGDEIVRELLLELRRTETNGKKAAASENPGESSTAAGNPLVSIARQMRDVERRIGKNDCGKDTQQTQQQIVDQLDRLIEQAKKSCCGGKPGEKQCKGGTSDRKKVAQAKKPSKSKKTGKGSKSGQSSGNASVEKPAPSNRTDMEQMQALIKRLWGELPERDRERMLQYPVEQFLPEYERLIEKYYKRLSEGKDD